MKKKYEPRRQLSVDIKLDIFNEFDLVWRGLRSKDTCWTKNKLVEVILQKFIDLNDDVERKTPEEDVVEPRVSVSLRLPKSMVKKIDGKMKEDKTSSTRNAWLAQEVMKVL